jgi:hypothetical protein
MSNRLTKQGKVTFIAAIPAVVATPARCVTTTGNAVKYFLVTDVINLGYEVAPGYPVRMDTHEENGQTVIDNIYYPFLVPNSKVTVCYPAVKGVAGREASVITEGFTGWNSGARSVDSVDNDFSVSFQLPYAASGAVICGMAPDSVSIGDFAAIQHGLYSAGGGIKVYESGIELATLSISADDASALVIQRIAGVVTYRAGINSYISGQRSSGPKKLTAAMYTAGDYVDSPTLGTSNSGSSFAPLSLGTPTAANSGSSFELNLLGGTASGKNAKPIVVPDIGLDGIATEFDLVMSAIDIGLSIDPGVLNFDVTPTARMSEEFQSGIRFAMDAPTISAYDTDSFFDVSLVEGIIAQSEPYFQPVLFATINEKLRLGSVIDFFIAIDARIAEMLVISDRTDASLLITALIQGGLTLSDYSLRNRITNSSYTGSDGGIQYAAANEAIQYATNIATGAVTRYVGFGFTSFCRVGQVLYGVRQDGLYKIGGDTDDGKLLSFLIDFAAEDQGTARTKRLENIFFGITTDGQALARLKDDYGREITYKLIQRDSSESRINTAKGVSSRYWHLRLEVEEASYAEIDNIEWVAATGARRTKR